MKCVKPSEPNCPNRYTATGECLIGFCYAMIDNIESTLQAIAETELKILNALTSFNLLSRTTQSTPEPKSDIDSNTTEEPEPVCTISEVPEPEPIQQPKKRGRKKGWK